MWFIMLFRRIAFTMISEVLIRADCCHYADSRRYLWVAFENENYARTVVHSQNRVKYILF